MNLTPIIARLRDECPTLRFVAGAAEFERALSETPTLPAAFAIEGNEGALPNPFGNQLTEQEITAELVIVIAAENLADASGAAAHNAMHPVRLAVRSALLGWPPADDCGGFEFVDDNFVHFGNGVLWRQQRYRTQFVIRSE